MKKFFLVATTLLLIFSISLLPTSSAGISLSPGIDDVIVQPNSSTERKVRVENRDGYDKEFAITTATYDPQTEQILTTEPFIVLSEERSEIAANSEKEIGYTIQIPKETPLGTYFNIITAEQISQGQINGSLDIRMGLGTIVAIHVVDSESTIEQIFKENSSTQLTVTNKGFPYFASLKAEFTYTNNSNFVFRPQGEIRITDEKGLQVAERVEINPDRKAIYKGQSITTEIESPIWNIFNARDAKTVSSRVYNGLGGEYIQNQVSVDIKSTTYIAAGVIALLTLITMGKVYSILFKKPT